MQIGIAHVVSGLVVIALLIGSAFTIGTKWRADAESQEASAGSALEEMATSSEPEDVQGNPAPEIYSVIKVVDGDTIAISMNGKSETVRLIGIDTPETVDTRVDVQCFGKESSDTLKSLLGGKKVRLEIDEGEGERDKYKRLLAYVFREDGLFVNKHMIEEGYAYEYTYDTTYKYQKEFKAAEAGAQKAEKGLWAPEACPKSEVKAAPEVKGNASAKKEESPAPSAQPAPQSSQTSVQPPQAASQTNPEPEPAPSSAQNSSSYTCSANTYNCTDFTTQAEAQAVFDQCGGASNDIHKLDSNKDGEACESLP